MALIPMRPLLEAAQKYGYAQGGFNVNAVSQVRATIDMHEIFRAPVLLQGADLANGFMGGKVDFFQSTIEDKRAGAKNLAAAAEKYAKEVSVPVALHLDHGKDMDSVIAAIDGGYTSVMIDGSSLPFDQNVELTREVVRYAHERGVTVEGELGVLAGVEDSVFSESSTYTNPLRAVDFFKQTGVDCLAIAYGTMHGPMKGKDVKLRCEIPVAIAENLRHEGIFGALVSHGSSTVPGYIIEEINALGGAVKDAHGVPIEELQQAIRAGICKINVDTDIRVAVTRNLRELTARNLPQGGAAAEIARLLAEKPAQVDPRSFFAPIMDAIMYGKIESEDVREIIGCVATAVCEAVGPLVAHFGAVGRAPLVKRTTLEEMAEFYKKEGKR